MENILNIIRLRSQLDAARAEVGVDVDICVFLAREGKRHGFAPPTMVQRVVDAQENLDCAQGFLLYTLFCA